MRPNSRVFEFEGESGDKHYWTERLNLTSWHCFYARILRWEADSEKYPLCKVFTPLLRRSYRTVEGKLSNFEKCAGGCWLWKGNKTHDGYGRVRIKGKKRRAHILSYEYAFGAVPVGMMVCHRCGNPLCINPEHLYAGTSRDNYADMVRHGTSNRPCGERVAKAKLTEVQVLEIRLDPRTTRELAKVYGVGKSTIQQAKVGLTWKHLPIPTSDTI